MQLLLFNENRTSLLKGIDARLRDYFGQPGPWRRLDPVSQLILAMVGCRTRGTVSRTAVEALICRFGRWECVRDASADEICKAIQAVTYAETKARHVAQALRMITSLRGSLTLAFLGDWSAADALIWLERLPGVGRKVAAATLNFSTLQMRALVIDTHHLRVLRRVGLLDQRADYRAAYDRIMPLLPAGWTASDLDDHHQLMKTLGQTVCRHDRPRCDQCPLNDLCRTGRKVVARKNHGDGPALCHRV